jgi:hypothetical protein
MVCEDLGAPKLAMEMNQFAVNFVPVDGGSGVNIMIDTTAEQLGYHTLQPTARTMRLVDGARVLPKGILTHILTLIGGREFYLNFLVMKPARPSPFPVLLGRPWLYGAGVCADWKKKDFRFGEPMICLSWKQEGCIDEFGRLEEESSLEEELEDEVYMVRAIAGLEEKDVFPS